MAGEDLARPSEQCRGGGIPYTSDMESAASFGGPVAIVLPAEAAVGVEGLEHQSGLSWVLSSSNFIAHGSQNCLSSTHPRHDQPRPNLSAVVTSLPNFR